MNLSSSRSEYYCDVYINITHHVVFSRPAAHSAASIILRGPNDYYVDEMERSIHDSLSVVKRVFESNSVVPGGGAVETALSIYLENLATSIVSHTATCRIPSQLLSCSCLDLPGAAGCGGLCTGAAHNPKDTGSECSTRLY